jgi:hypothetical protein
MSSVVPWSRNIFTKEEKMLSFCIAEAICIICYPGRSPAQLKYNVNLICSIAGDNAA